MLALILLIAAGAPAPDPLAPARQGLVQCRRPLADKTCGTIVTYTPQADGSLRSLARVRLSNPRFIVEIPGHVRVEDGLVCDPTFADSGPSTQLLFDGVPASASASAEFHAAWDPVYAPLRGKRVCARYDKAKGMMRNSVVLVDGAPVKDMGGPFMWVRPEEYTLAYAPT